MEKLCPLENDCFIFPYKDNKYIKKHLKKCPLYIKNLYLHYTPFYFPYINDSNTYILKHKDVENMLNEYYILFNNIILDTIKKKMSIPIKTFDNFLYMKYNLLLIWYIKYGKDVFFSMLENDIYKEKLHNKLNNNINKSNIVDINIEEQNLLFYIHINKLKDIICNKRNIYNNNKERNPKYCVNEFVIQKNEISTPHIYNNNNICLEKDYNNYNTSTKEQHFCDSKKINDHDENCNSPNKKGGCNKMDERQNDEYKKSINMYKQHDESNKYTLPILTLKNIGNIHNYKITRDIINYVDVFIFRYPDFFDDEERKRKGAKRKKNDNNKKNDGNNNPNDGNNNPNDGNNNQNDGNKNPNDGNNNQNDGNNNQNDDDYKNIFDETKNKTSFKLVEKNELDKDEILSIIIYLTIYLCCKLNIMKRIKNKNFNRKDMEKIKEKDIYSIFFFLNNLDKHDIQNINLLFLLVYFNNSFYVHFHNLLNQKEIFISSTHTNIQSLFIELGAGKANTTRWINFIMNNLGDILQKYNVNKGEPKNDDKKMSYINNDNNKKNDQHNILCTNEPSALLHPSQAAYEKCKMLIIEKESLRNKKEMKDFFMQIEHNNNENILRIRTNVSDFNLNKFIHFIKDKNVQENHFLVPDIIQFYYYNDIYKKIEKEKGKENKELNTKDEQSKYITHIKKFNSDKTSFISEEFLKNNLLCIESYLDINMKKLFTALTQGNNNLKKVYNNVNNFLKDLDFQKVTYLTKHLCGNGSDLALRMLVNSVKDNVVENYFILAPCCHHRCEVKKIVGYKYLKELNIDKNLFQHMVNHMSGYASCNVPEKKSIGKKIKLVIDLSRILYLLEEGLQNSYLIKYVNRHITLENYAIVFFNHQNLNLTNFKYF
ncbi:hypothetical protein PFAG_03412 [Plasmodium falciparum Santa Lucia]|uniref:tRNA:m(4)X modification enzyme TRM13 n=1 Tax=Plasmodium falciparum Santa Lucia TaxID=478859 RepID=W7FMX9_PLAFA|nr:hypothetical protein PFAG_03412 [Plasmodium falciparum Santa Lucia]